MSAPTARAVDSYGNGGFYNPTDNKWQAIADKDGGFRCRAIPDYYTLDEDFLKELDGSLAVAVGSDTSAPALTTTAGGVLRLTTGNTGNKTATEDAVSVTHQLFWKASQGSLKMEARIKGVTTVAGVRYFVGFTDTLATTTLESPFSLSAESLSSTTSNGCGLLFDTDATNDYWHLVGCATDTDATTQILNSGPVADTFYRLSVTLDTAGIARFYIDGVQVGSAMTGAVTASTLLTPVVFVIPTGASARSLDLDYLYCSNQRP